MNLFLQNRRRLAILAGSVVLAIVAAIALIATAPRATANTVAARRGNISATVTATGKVQSSRSAKLALQMSGMVASIKKHEGDDVAAGDVILELKADDVNRRVQQAQLNVQNRQLDLQRAKAAPSDEDIEIARANLQKAMLAAAAADANYTASPTTQNDGLRQAARADLDIARANFNRTVNGPTQDQLDQLQNAVTAAQLDLDSAKASLAQAKLSAPYTSTVTEVDVRDGELAGAGMQLAAVADLKALQIAAEIDEIDVANVANGQTVQVRLDAFPGESFDGTVTRLFPAASTARGATVYDAIVDFDPKGLQVRLGMGGSLKIKTIEKQGVLLVPNNAIKNIGTQKAVHIVSPGPERDVIVETGVTDGSNTEIVRGVNEGDSIQIP